MGFPGGSVVENMPQYRRHGFDPWVSKSPGKGKGNPGQYSCLENPMDQGAWQVIVDGVTKELDTTERLNMGVFKTYQAWALISLDQNLWRWTLGISHLPRSPVIPICGQRWDPCPHQRSGTWGPGAEFAHGLRPESRTAWHKVGGWQMSINISVHACVLSSFSHVQLFATLWTVACQAPLSVGFSRQEYRSGLHCSPPNSGIKPTPASTALQVDSLPLGHRGSPNISINNPNMMPI